jgi:hypothetical protein
MKENRRDFGKGYKRRALAFDGDGIIGTNTRFSEVLDPIRLVVLHGFTHARHVAYAYKD